MSRLETLLCAELKRQLSAKGVCVTHIPAGGELLWRWFTDLNRTRRMGYAAPEPITYAEIMAYAHIMRQAIEPRHVAIITAMDRVYLEHHAQERRRQTPEGVKTLPPVSKRPLSAGLLDAMFGR